VLRSEKYLYQPYPEIQWKLKLRRGKKLIMPCRSRKRILRKIIQKYTVIIMTRKKRMIQGLEEEGRYIAQELSFE